jgi:hypothetical protein
MSEFAALCSKTPEQLQAEEIQRQTLEDAAKRLEVRGGSSSYVAAWKAAAKFLRSLKP